MIITTAFVSLEEQSIIIIYYYYIYLLMKLLQWDDHGSKKNYSNE